LSTTDFTPAAPRADSGSQARAPKIIRFCPRSSGPEPLSGTAERPTTAADHIDHRWQRVSECFLECMKMRQIDVALPCDRLSGRAENSADECVCPSLPFVSSEASGPGHPSQLRVQRSDHPITAPESTIDPGHHDHRRQRFPYLHCIKNRMTSEALTIATRAHVSLNRRDLPWKSSSLPSHRDHRQERPQSKPAWEHMVFLRAQTSLKCNPSNVNSDTTRERKIQTISTKCHRGRTLYRGIPFRRGTWPLRALPDQNQQNPEPTACWSRAGRYPE